MRIAFVVHGYPPEQSAGVELLAHEQALAQQERGHEVAVFARGYAERATSPGARVDEVVDGVGVRRVQPRLEATGFLSSVENAAFDEPLRELLAAFQPEVVHVQHLVMLSLSLVRVIREAAVPCVVSLHDAFFLCHRLFLLDRDGTRCPGPDAGARCEPCLEGVLAAGEARARFDAAARALAAADAIVAPSRALAARYERELPFLAGRISVVDPGVRAPAAPPEARAPVGSAPIRLLFVGTWLPHKGLDLLIDACARLDPERYRLSVYGEPVAGREDFAHELRERTVGAPIAWCGRFAAADLPAVLARGDVLVLPSRCDESYSRVVREARAAGLAVVAPATGGPGEALRDGVDALLVPPADGAALERALRRLIDEPGLARRLASAPASFPSPEEAAARFEAIYADLARTAAQPGHRRSGAPPRVTVAYVTKNGRPWLAESLRAVRAQRGPFELVEILAIDSGSSDDTLEVLAAAGARILRIAPQEFGHGRTRNLAAREARGDVVAFLTQDATPADDHWLAALVAPLASDPLLAGVWSRHLPRPDCHPMEWRTIEEFPLFAGPAVRVSEARGNPAYAAQPDLFSWFSNNASAFPRSVLQRWPFPEVEFAEDQAWARLVLEAGFRTALVNDSRIFHSHAYSPWTNLRRHFDHSRAMTEELGRIDPLPLSAGLRAAFTEARRDVAFWAGRCGRPAARVAPRLAPRALAYHLGAFGGRWLGAHARQLPSGVRRWLSLHDRRRASR